MVKILNTRKTEKTVFLGIDDGTHCGARKLSIDKYKYAKSFKNPDFLAAVSKRTTVKKDLRESLKARSFVDKDIQYSEALQ